MDRSKVVLGFILLFSISMLVTPVHAQEYKEETGTVTTYSWPEGVYEYNADTQTYISNPSKVFTWTAPKDAWGYFYVEDPGYTDGPWLPNWRYQGESEFGSGNFNVEQGDVLEIQLWPRIYDDGYYFTDEMEMIQWWKYHAQSGAVKYFIGYTETVESVLDADFSYSPSKPQPGDQVTVSSTSTVVNAEITSLVWYLNGDHRTEYDNLESWSWTPSQMGSYTLELEVWDSTGKSDFIVKTIEVEEEASYTILDQAFTTGLQNNEPVDRKTSFTYGDDIIFWMKLGEVKGTHSVYIEWETPRERETLTNTRVEIPSPSTQGLTQWSEYIVSHSIKQTDSTYNQIISDPGTWTISVWIDSEQEYRYSFTIDSNVVHSAEIPKTKYITREKVDITGSVTKNGEPIYGAEIGIEVYDKDGNIIDYSSGFSTGADGKYNAFYEIPFVTDPTTATREKWTLKITADIDGQYYDVEKEISVMPIWFDVQQISLVQTIETIPYEEIYKLVGGKEAGVRVTFNCPTRRGTSGYTKPEIEVELIAKKEGQIVYSETRKINAISKIVNHDFIFKLDQPGDYELSLQIDSNSLYTSYEMPEDYWKSLRMDWDVRVAEMEPLRIMFVPVDMQWKANTDPTKLTPEDQQELREYISFCQKHIEFIKDVYPLPESKFTFTISPRNIGSYWPVSHRVTYSGQYIAATLWLSADSAASNNRLVAVLPATTLWWDKPETTTTQGFASAYISSRSCGIKETAFVGVAAHEVAHLLGLYRWTEQYKITEHGFPVTGLILKDGRIYDLDVEAERHSAFTINTASVRCFMGTNAGGSFSSWVSQDTYLQLLKALGDPPHVPVLLIGGVVNSTGVYDQQFIEYNGLPDTWPEGRFTAKLVDSTGTVLYEQDFGGDADESFFCFSTLFPDNTAAIEFYKDDVLITTEPVSSYSPNVSIDSFNEQSGGATVSWSISDPDSDQCTSTIVFSNDGANWITLDIGVTGTSYSFDYEGLPGGDTCYIKVIGHDGVRTSETTYGTFSVPTNQPNAFITSYTDGETTGQEVTLTGAGYDLDDGMLTTLNWVSSLDGVLGTGESVQTNLTLGTHTITLTVSDDDGNTATAQISLTVEQTTTTTGIVFNSHTTTDTIPDVGETPQTKTSYTIEETVYSLVQFESASPGDNITWIFQGPDQPIIFEYIVDDTTTTGVYSALDLTDYTNTQGTWTITLIINGEITDTKTFTVTEPLTGYKWWGPFLGAAILLALAAGGIILLRQRKKTPQNTQPQTPIQEQQPKQQYCSECGGEATWIPQYQRWYCYNCKKYLE
ncbi:MAG: hypothetical protein NWF07_09285 [Candidatus Bathyarchaeota archaeon]|nr:hypothetical protein [Candidatus Bathyarchaeota archaeon]